MTYSTGVRVEGQWPTIQGLASIEVQWHAVQELELKGNDMQYKGKLELKGNVMQYSIKYNPPPPYIVSNFILSPLLLDKKKSTVCMPLLYLWYEYI